MELWWFDEDSGSTGKSCGCTGNHGGHIIFVHMQEARFVFFWSDSHHQVQGVQGFKFMVPPTFGDFNSTQGLQLVKKAKASLKAGFRPYHVVQVVTPVFPRLNPLHNLACCKW